MNNLYFIILNDTLKVQVVNQQESLIEYLKNPNTIIAISAILVSVIGLCIATRYNRKTLKNSITHNKLSVKPLISFKQFEDHVNFSCRLEMKNYGLGPAKINSFNLICDDQEFADIIALITEKNKEIFKTIIYKKSSTWELLGSKTYFAPEESEIIYH